MLAMYPRGRTFQQFYAELKTTKGASTLSSTMPVSMSAAISVTCRTADWETIREVNLDGVVRIARDAFELMRKSGNASLINLASIMGHRGLRQLAGYSATKGAVSALTRALAVEYAPYGIRVNALAPGFIETALTERVLRNPMINKALLDQTPLRRFGSPVDVANAALFLASDESAFVTGAEIAVDGGMAAGL